MSLLNLHGSFPVRATCLFLFQNLGGYNPVLRPRVVGQWVGREEEDTDLLAAEMLRPPLPRAKTEVCWSGDNSPAGRWVLHHTHNCVISLRDKKNLETSGAFAKLLLAKLGGGILAALPEECPSERA